jgi:hypothetical protein
LASSLKHFLKSFKIQNLPVRKIPIVIYKNFDSVNHSEMGCWRECLLYMGRTGRESGLIRVMHANPSFATTREESGLTFNNQHGFTPNLNRISILIL